MSLNTPILIMGCGARLSSRFSTLLAAANIQVIMAEDFDATEVVSYLPIQATSLEHVQPVLRPEATPYGPPRKGRGGKLRRW